MHEAAAKGKYDDTVPSKPSLPIGLEELVHEVTEALLPEMATRLNEGKKEDSMDKKRTEGYF